MNKWLAAGLLIGAGLLQGCVYDPYSGTYVPAGGYSYGYGYAPYPSYSYPEYGYPSPGFYGGTVLTTPGWGWGGYHRDWDDRFRDRSHEGDRRGDRHESGNRPVNLGSARPAHPQAAVRPASPGGAHPGGHDRDRDHDRH